MNSVQLTRELLAIPSPSGSEQEIGEFLVKRLEKNFDVRTQAVGERFNILATRGEPRVLFATHIDTVPGLLELKEDSTTLYGRGACDTKGIIAAMVCAAEAAVAEDISGFGLLFDVSEETDFSGVAQALNLASPELVIIGEPTSMKVARGQKGLLGITLRCEGKAAPGATPELGVSAISLLLQSLRAIESLHLPEDSLLGKTTLNIGLMRGGSAVNVVADEAQATIEFRTARPAAEILALVEVAAGTAKVEVLYAFDPVLASVQSVPAGLETCVVPYFTEAYFWAAKARTIIFGPGEYAFAHSDNEQIRKDDLLEGTCAYLEMLRCFGKERTVAGRTYK